MGKWKISFNNSSMVNKGVLPGKSERVVLLAPQRERFSCWLGTWKGLVLDWMLESLMGTWIDKSGNFETWIDKGKFFFLFFSIEKRKGFFHGDDSSKKEQGVCIVYMFVRIYININTYCLIRMRYRPQP